MKKKTASVVMMSIVLAQLCAGSVAQAQNDQFNKTPLLSDKEVAALGAEISGVIAKDTVIELARSHRVQASSGYSQAARYIAAKAKAHGLDQVLIDSLTTSNSSEVPNPDSPSDLRSRMADFFSSARNVSIASAAIFLLGLGEELWKKFLPKYLEALGASTPLIGLFGTAENFLDAIYQYPGGWLSDRLGQRRAFLIFVALAAVGYVVYYFAFSPPLVFLGLAFAMAWQSMASPAIFAVIGDSLPPERRAMGFTLQSILKRIPIVRRAGDWQEP